MKEEKTIHQIAMDNDVHPPQVMEWKKMLVENISGVFEGGKRAGKEDFEKERQRLHSKIGQLTVEVDFLEKKSKQLGLGSEPSWSKHNIPN